MSRLALFPAPFRSHVGLTVRLAVTLERAGHAVTVFAPEIVRPAAAAAGLRDVRPDPRGDGVAAELRVLDRPPGDPAAALATRVALAEACAGRFTELTEELLALAPDVVLGDALAPWSRLAARWLGRPHATLAVAHTLAPRAPVPAGATRVPELEARLRAADRVLVPLARMSRDVPERTIAFTSPRLSGGELLDPVSTRFVGPLIESRSPRASAEAGPRPSVAAPVDDSRPLVDDSRPLVYVALGTVATERPGVLRAVLAGLADRPVRVRLVTWRWLDPDRLGAPPANAQLLTEADQLAELDAAAVFVTHAGVNSVLEALVAGVPMVCVPGAGDQFAGAERVAALGAGVTLGAGDPSPVAIAAAVDTVRRDPGYAARARALGEELRAIDGPSVARGLIGELTAG